MVIDAAGVTSAEQGLLACPSPPEIVRFQLRHQYIPMIFLWFGLNLFHENNKSMDLSGVKMATTFVKVHSVLVVLSFL